MPEKLLLLEIGVNEYNNIQKSDEKIIGIAFIIVGFVVYVQFKSKKFKIMHGVFVKEFCK